MIDIHPNHPNLRNIALLWSGMIHIHRYLALNLQQIVLHILEDGILTIADLPDTVETLFKDLPIE